jgi:hypothetical protein
LIGSPSAIIRMDVKDKTKRGIEFLHILNGMLSQTGTVDVARRPAVPDAASKKGEPNVQEILCQEDMKDKTYMHIIDVPGAIANKNFNTYSPEDGQTYYMASMTETERIAMTAFTSDERKAGGHN